LPSQGAPIDKAFRANYERLKAERLAREAVADWRPAQERRLDIRCAAAN